VNANALMPEPGLDDVTIPHLYLTQFLSEKIAVAIGKLDTTGGDMNEFAHYANNETFLNLAFAFNPVTAATVPYSTLGASLILLPVKNLVISLAAVDGEGTATRSGFDTIFEGRTAYSAEVTLTTNLFNLPGHHLLGGVYGRGSYGELDQELTNFLPGGRGLTRSDESWSVYYNVQQYFWTTPDDKTRGWGFFGRAGLGDEKTNPIAQFYSAGFGGKGLGTIRPHDRWGIGWYFMKTSDELPDFLELGDEQGGEVFYNFAVTPAFMVTADLQVIDSARKHVDTAVVGAVRATLRF
jgi:porin